MTITNKIIILLICCAINLKLHPTQPGNDDKAFIQNTLDTCNEIYDDFLKNPRPYGKKDGHKENFKKCFKPMDDRYHTTVETSDTIHCPYAADFMTFAESLPRKQMPFIKNNHPLTQLDNEQKDWFRKVFFNNLESAFKDNEKKVLPTFWLFCEDAVKNGCKTEIANFIYKLNVIWEPRKTD